MKILAVDFGMKRVGFAVGNTVIQTAVPIDPVERKSSRHVIAHIRTLLAEYDIQQVVVGYPLNMDGTKSTVAEQVEHFVRRLTRAIGPDITVELVDERLSSFEARETLKTHPLEFKKMKPMVDSMAAVVILNRFIEDRHDLI